MKVRMLFDGPPGPECGRFVETEDERGKSIRLGEWMEQPPYWVLEFEHVPLPDREALARWFVTRLGAEAVVGDDEADALLDWLKDQPAPKEPSHE